MRNDNWFKYLENRLNSIERKVAFIISSCIIIAGLLFVQLFKVIDEYLLDGKIECVDILRLVGVILGIAFIIIVAIRGYTMLRKRRKKVMEIIENKLKNEEYDIFKDWNDYREEFEFESVIEVIREFITGKKNS